MKFCKNCESALTTAEEIHWGICKECGKDLAAGKTPGSWKQKTEEAANDEVFKQVRQNMMVIVEGIEEKLQEALSTGEFSNVEAEAVRELDAKIMEEFDAGKYQEAIKTCKETIELLDRKIHGGDDTSLQEEEGGEAQAKDTERAYRIIETLSTMEPEEVTGETGDKFTKEIVEDIRFLGDTGLISLFQPPIVTEEVYQKWLPFIERFAGSNREDLEETIKKEIPPNQPANPHEPAPMKGQPNYPNIEKFNEEEVSQEDIDYLQWQIGNLDTAHEELWNDVSSGHNPLERVTHNEEEAEGHCDNCGGYGDCRFYEPHGTMLCKDCRAEARRLDKINRSEEDTNDADACPNCGCFCTDRTVEECPCKEGGCGDCGCGFKDERPKERDMSDLDEAKEPTSEPEPDPSNPSKSIDKDPDIPAPVEPQQNVSAEGVDIPDKIEIPERLYNDIQMMMEYSITNDNEAGGFIIKAKTGDLGVVGEQFGKDREIVLEPNEQLHEGEELIGTYHSHPVTPTGSTGDVTSYLRDENEKVMIVGGADKSINIFIKVPSVIAEGDYGDEISENFGQEDMGMLAEGLGFLWYRAEESDRTEAHLLNNVANGIEFNIKEEVWPIEELVKGLGIKGIPEIPPEYSQKKTPLSYRYPSHGSAASVD